MPIQVGAPIQIGVIVSLYTATGPSFEAQPYGFGHADLARVFQKAGYEVSAVIEPGAEKEPDLQKALQDLGLSERWVDGSDAAALANLDVIVSGSNPNMRDEVIAGITEAVRQGAAFLNLEAFGTVNPPYNKRIETLLGIRDGEFHWRSQPMPCEVVEPHPLLGDLRKGERFMIPGLDAWAGAVDGTPLLQPAAEVRDSGSGSADVCPLYVRSLGKGKVLNCQWRGDLAEAGAPITSEEFTVRCVAWLARPETPLPPLDAPTGDWAAAGGAPVKAGGAPVEAGRSRAYWRRTTVFSESFPTDIAPFPGDDPRYSDWLTGANSDNEFRVQSGVLRICGGQRQSDGSAVVTAQKLIGQSTFGKALRVTARMGGEPGPVGNWHVGLILGGVRVVYHLGYEGGALRIDRQTPWTRLTENLNVGFAPTPGYRPLQRIEVLAMPRDDGEYEFEVTLTERDRPPFMHSFALPASQVGSLSQVGFHRQSLGRAGEALFDDLRIEQIELPDAGALNAPRGDGQGPGRPPESQAKNP